MQAGKYLDWLLMLQKDNLPKDTIQMTQQETCIRIQNMQLSKTVAS